MRLAVFLVVDGDGVIFTLEFVKGFLDDIEALLGLDEWPPRRDIFGFWSKLGILNIFPLALFVKSTKTFSIVTIMK